MSLKIMAIERDKTACNYYRLLVPLHTMDEQGLAEVHFIEEKDLLQDRARDMALWADIIVFQRPATEAWFNFIKTCRKYGKVVISDYDDDPFNTSPLNPYYQYIGTEPVLWKWADGTDEWLWSEDMVSASGKKIFNIEANINHRDMFRLNFKKSDLVTCTTNLLRNEFLKINPNVAVLPNCIDPDFFPKNVEMVKKNIRIGWQGGCSHYEDLYMMRPSIVEILNKNKNVTFVYFGDMRFQGLFKDAPQDQIEYHPWVQHNAYPFQLTLLNLDIGLCPLVDNQFNRNKSSIKWMEYSMVGACTLASDVPPYNIDIKNDKTGLLIKDEEWTGTLQKLIDNKDLRLTLAKAAKEDVLLNHNINTKAHLWAEAYEKAMKGQLVTV